MSKVNGSLFKLYLVEMVGSSPAVRTEYLITEQISMTLSRSTNTIDVTSKDNNGYEEFLGGLKSGEASVDFIMDLDKIKTGGTINYIELSAIEAARTVKTYCAKLNDGKKTLSSDFNALITKFDTGSPMEDKITISCTFKRSGAPAETITTNP